MSLKRRLQRSEDRIRAEQQRGQKLVRLEEVYPSGWTPQSVPQRMALESLADILFFGGAAGSLKTETILVDAAREVLNPNLRAIIFRSKLTQLTDIVDKSYRLYPSLGGKYSPPTHTWTFPSGATIRFAYIATDKDVFEYLGPRYSYIAFDESTFHTESQVRNMLGRLSSTDPRLKLRLRLASNPGGIGARWHKTLFLQGHCPVHNPGASVRSGELFWNARWPSDQQSIGPFSTAFIAGRLQDHNLLDENYVHRLRGMSGSLSLAMEQGCWCALDGAYFANWDPRKMVIPYAAIGENFWDSHFISLDYGFGRSSASSHLHVRTQDGRVRTIGEFVAQRLPAYEFARQVMDRFALPLLRGQRRTIVAVYLDPANFRNIGAGSTIAEQMNAVLETYGLGLREASNDRVGGFQRMYQMLQTGEWQIADTCPLLIEAIPTRLHDENKPGDVLKVPGDPLDDVIDDVRYGLYSFLPPAEKPRELIIREALRPMAEAGALTSCLIRYQQMTEEAEPQPIRIGRYIRPWRRR